MSEYTMPGDPMEQRIAAIERRQAELEQRMDDFGEEIKKNTATTNEIKADTGQMLTLFKASKLGADLVKWLASVGGGLIIAYAAFKGMSGH